MSMLTSEEGSKLTAIYYERVSTQNSSQDESLESQRALAESFLRRHKEIILVEPLGTYSERVSGKSDVREKYQKMLRRLEEGDVDVVLVKDLKRINRSIEVSAQLREHAMKYGYKFILLSTGSLYDPNKSENRMLYSFESLMNEEVVYRQSEYARLAHRQRCEAKRLTQNSVIRGYRWNATTGDMEVDPEAAKIIQELFDELIFHDLGILELRRYLSRRGVCVSANTVSNYLRETAYIGCFVINKKGSELHVGAGKRTIRYTRPKEEWIEIHRPDLRILSDETFNLAQRILEERKNRFEADVKGNVQGRFSGTHIFSAMVYCGECGCSYLFRYSDRAQKRGVYRDSFKIKSKDYSVSCTNQEYKTISEKELLEICAEAINGVVVENKNVLPKVMSALEKAFQDSDSSKQVLEEKKRRIKKLAEEAEKISDSFVHASGALLKNLNERYNNTTAEIERLNQEILLLSKQDKSLDLKMRIRDIHSILSQWPSVSADQLDRKTIKNFVERITIYKNGKIEIKLNSARAFTYELKKKEENPVGAPPSFSVIPFPTDSRKIYNQFVEILKALRAGEKAGCNLTVMSFTHIKSKRYEIEVEIEVR